MTAAYDVTGSLSTAGYADVPITAAEPDRVLVPGDTLYWICIGGAAWLPATADLRGVIEIAIQS